MKLTRIALLAFGAAAICLSAACGTSNITINSGNSNTAVVNANKTNANKTTPATNSAVNQSGNSDVNKPAEQKSAKADAGTDEVSGELQVGKTESVILYFGEESGDYAGYCFANDSEAGRAIFAACKDKEQCAVKGTVDFDAKCAVPGLEADLSASGRILKVGSAQKAARK